MKNFKKSFFYQAALLFVLIAFFSSCLTSKKMDKFVADQYGDQIPAQDKKKKADITVTSGLAGATGNISTTVQKTSKVLPLIVYWQWDYRHTCALNPAIGVNNFSNTVNTLAGKSLSPKLNGKKLELMVEQMPASFALVDKAHLIWIIYAITWDKIYIEPDFKDLVVAYKAPQPDGSFKTGKITIKNAEERTGIRHFQSWKSATSEYLDRYNAGITDMAKIFISKLVAEL